MKSHALEKNLMQFNYRERKGEIWRACFPSTVKVPPGVLYTHFTTFSFFKALIPFGISHCIPVSDLRDAYNSHPFTELKTSSVLKLMND